MCKPGMEEDRRMEEEDGRIDYPFAAVVGQEDLKQCLVLCAVDPTIGGVLIRGDKGTAKSTAARGMARLLPPIEVRCDPQSGAFDPYNRGVAPSIDDEEFVLREVPTPFVDLPIGATEDRVLGSVDFSATLKGGGKSVFSPGLLAAANRGILYIDEVNLLPAHLVDVLLDAAASGVNTIQREGVNTTHPARFILIGTMNPEEGDLRPQLLDRFGLMVDVVAPRDARVRSDVVRQRIAFERDAAGFRAKWEAAEALLARQIRAAKDLLPRVTLPDDLLLLTSRICIELGVDSLRADITLCKTATALAAWDGRTTVEAGDIKKAAGWVLAHRRRQQPFESPKDKQDTSEKLDQLVNDAQQRGDHEKDFEGSENDRGGPTTGGDTTSAANTGDHNEPSSRTDDNGSDDNNKSNDGDDEHQMQTFTASKPDQIRRLKLDKQQRGQPGTGRRNQLLTNNNTPPRRGRCVRSVPTDKPVDLALDATLRAAAPNGLDADTGRPIVRPDNWRRKVRQNTTDTLVLFVVDASGSMAARQRMEAVKGAVVALLTDAYQQRDSVGVIAFRGTRAEVLLSPTKSVELAEKQLQRLPTGGRTPLAHALLLASETVQRLRQRGKEDEQQAVLLVVLSDGRANVPLPDSSPPQGGDSSWTQTQQAATELAALAVPTLMLDTEAGHVVRIGRGKELAELLEADYLRLDELGADGLIHTIRRVVAQ